MSRFNYLLNLSHFGEGGAGASASAGGEGTAMGDGGAVENTAPKVSDYTHRQKKKGDYDNVKFGKQAGDSGTAEPISDTIVTNASAANSAGNINNGRSTSDALEERKNAFQSLINGEYKDLYTQATQEIINRRFKETKNLEAEKAKVDPIINMLYEKYGVSDADKLMEAIEDDSMYWADEADEAGMTVEQYKQFKKLERQNAELIRNQQESQRQTLAQRQTDQWIQEAMAMQERFPDFDLGAELENPQFTAMLKAGTPVEHAYKVMHFDELIDNAMTTASKQMEKQVVDNIRAKGMRPAENGTSSQASFVVKDDVHKLTKRDRAEAIRRAMGGETISF